MKRILHVVTYMGRGGLETMIMNYYRHIDRTKVQFDFLVHRADEADYDDEIKQLGGKIYRLPPMNPFSPHYLKQLNVFFANHSEYKIVHVHQDCMSAIILKAAKKNGVPIRIAHSHNSNQDKNLKYPIKLHYRNKISKFATDFFACSSESGDWMFRGTQYKILNNAINAQDYAFSAEIRQNIRKSLNIPNDAFVLGHIGRFAPVKNHVFLINLFNELYLNPKNAYLLLIGDGELRKTIECKVSELKLNSRVIFLGVCNNVNELLSAMDVFVMPSIYEGLPVSIVEAQSNGLPCIVSHHFSKDCDITPLIERISLDAPIDIWLNAINDTSKKRIDTISYIKKAGFDIKQNALWLQDYYIKQWESI